MPQDVLTLGTYTELHGRVISYAERRVGLKAQLVEETY